MPKLETLSGPQKLPDRVCVYGIGGVGKSTLAKLSPSPIYIDADDGTGKLDVARVNYGTANAPVFKPPTLSDYKGTLVQLATEKHAYETVVTDTLDAVEELVQREVCKNENMTPGEYADYGRGTKFAIKEWREIISLLSDLRTKRRMHVLLLSHFTVAAFKNPSGLDYERYTLKLEKAPAKLIYDWCDTVAFARFEDLAAKTPGDDPKRIRGLSTERRYLETQHNAAWDAKSRESVPREIDMDKDAWKKLNGGN